MNDDFSDLETELRAFQPVRPSAALEGRLSKALDGDWFETPALPWWQKLGFYRPVAAFAWGLATPAAAVCAVFVFHFTGATGSLPAASTSPGSRALISAAASSGGFEPAAASDVLYQTQDDGVVYDTQQKPSRQMRYRSQETLAWRNPHTGAQVEVSYPREETVVTPISLR